MHKDHYSATDLVCFQGCQYRTYLDLEVCFQQAEALRAEQVDAPQDIQMIAEKGRQHESHYFESLKKQGIDIVDITAVGHKLQAQTLATETALSQGVSYIYQAVLIMPDPQFPLNWLIKPDFLRKVTHPSALGPYAYEVIDTKIAQKTRASFIIQATLYTKIMALYQKVALPQFHFVLGTHEEVSYLYTESCYYVDELIEQFYAFIDAYHQKKLTIPYPEKCDSCIFCPWRTYCEKKWQADQYLNQIPVLTPWQIAHLKQHDITTLSALVEMPPKEQSLFPESYFKQLQVFATLILQAQKSPTPTVLGQILMPLVENEGLLGLPAAQEQDLYIEMRFDATVIGVLCYNVTLRVLSTHFLPEYFHFWAHSFEEEALLLGNVLDTIGVFFKQNKKLHIYHYGTHVIKTFERLGERHSERVKQIDYLFTHDVFVNLEKVLRESTAVSTQNYALPTVAPLFFQHQEPLATKGQLLYQYDQWRETDGQTDSVLLTQIEQANILACDAIEALHSWLLAKKNALSPYAEFKQAVLLKESAVSLDTGEVEQKILAQIDTQSDDNQKRFLQLVADLLNFYHREREPALWAMFERHHMNTAELIHDDECLGGLVRNKIIPVRSDSTRKQLYTYDFPAQQTRLREGKVCLNAATLETAGEIVELDAVRHRVVLRVSTNTHLPDQLSLIPDRPVRVDLLAKALVRYAESVAHDPTGQAFPAVTDLLMRRPPRMKNTPLGLPIDLPELCQTPEDRARQILKAILSLENSILFIQGPPGAGKTYIAARLIVNLLQRKARIALSSNSHKAIHNLLSAIEKRALELNINFSGVKKSSEQDPDSHYQSHYPFMTETFHNKEVFENLEQFQLVAGTAWLFAQPRFDQVFDYLFVDEAGQVSLANLVAIGLSAKRIILLGDQMQLGQPIQGEHPRESGLSVLDYFLEGKATVPPERGFFLGETWRMHPEICDFLSTALYDKRLQPRAHTASQRLCLTTDAHPALQPTGLHFIPIEHQNCTDSSEEEARLVTEIYHSLLTQFYEQEGQHYPIQNENILVVTPYNLQVQLLKAQLPEGARIGTIDKFQGQEAEVVIISMVTSDQENATRQMEFLYSKNRLNVAISRAKTLALLIANPALMSVSCENPEQISLVNTFCWIKRLQSH